MGDTAGWLLRGQPAEGFHHGKNEFHNNSQNHVKDLELILATHPGCPQVSSAAFLRTENSACPQ